MSLFPSLFPDFYIKKGKKYYAGFGEWVVRPSKAITYTSKEKAQKVCAKIGGIVLSSENSKGWH